MADGRLVGSMFGIHAKGTPAPEVTEADTTSTTLAKQQQQQQQQQQPQSSAREQSSARKQSTGGAGGEPLPVLGHEEAASASVSGAVTSPTNRKIIKSAE